MANWARICSISYSPGMSATIPAGGRFDKDKNNHELGEQVAIGALDSPDLIVLPEIAAALEAERHLPQVSAYYWRNGAANMSRR